MKSLALLVLFATVPLIGCHTPQEYVKIARHTNWNWEGKTEAYLLARRGAPQKVFEAEGTRYLIYSRHANFQNDVGNNNYQTSSGSADVSSGNGQKPLPIYCEQTFFVKNGVITRVQQKGNDCYSWL